MLTTPQCGAVNIHDRPPTEEIMARKFCFFALLHSLRHDGVLSFMRTYWPRQAGQDTFSQGLT